MTECIMEAAVGGVRNGMKHIKWNIKLSDAWQHVCSMQYAGGHFENLI
jgi:hypothetical protein